MWTIVLGSLPLLAVVDAIALWAARRQAMGTLAAGEAQDEVEDNIGRMMTLVLTGLFVVLFVVFYLVIRNPWLAFGAAAILGLINALLVFLLYTAIARR